MFPFRVPRWRATFGEDSGATPATPHTSALKALIAIESGKRWNVDSMAQARRIYQAIEPVELGEAEAALGRNDPAELLLVAIGVGLYSEDLAWSEDFCLRLVRHPHFNVRGNAILSLGHLARRFKTLNRPESIEAVRTGLIDADSYVCGQAGSAADDLEYFAKLRVRPAGAGHSP